MPDTSHQFNGNDELIRRIPLSHSHVTRDATGHPRLTSAVFKFKPEYPDDGLSVDILTILLESLSEEEALHEAVFNQTTKSGASFMAGIVSASIPIGYGLQCVHDPILATAEIRANFAHALIKGEIDRTMARNLAAACRLVEKMDK